MTKQVVRFKDLPDDIGSSHQHHTEANAASEAEIRVTKVHAPTFAEKIGSLVLRGNLTRNSSNRDPLFFYQVESVLGIGSMGSVTKVRKRKQLVGGSARRGLQEHFRKEKNLHTCFRIPLIGGVFQHCLKGQLEFNGSPTHVTDSVSFEADDNLTNESDDIVYAMKSIHLGRVTDERYLRELKNEISALKALDHPNIVKAIETFEHRKQIFIVMELCSGGDLYTRNPYAEAEAARITRSILSAISYMHSKNIIHRDLKYENVLFVDHSPHSEIKLIDFGLSAAFGNDELTDGVGTIYTMAPEVLQGKYSKQADLWSVGVIAFMLLSSQMPFYGAQRRDIIDKIVSGQFEFKGRCWRQVSQHGKDFVKQLLVLDPNYRLTADSALHSLWLNRQHTVVRDPNPLEIDSAHQSMIRYSKYSKLKKVALMIVAHKSTTNEIGILRNIFEKYDKNGHGQLNFEEFMEAIAEAGYSDEESRQIFDALDLDGSGMIRYTEFLASTIEAQGAIGERRLAEAFDRLDCDNTGYITVNDLREMLGTGFPDTEIDKIIQEADHTKDGKISCMEFLAQWQDQKEAKRQDIVSGISSIKLRQRPMDDEHAFTTPSYIEHSSTSHLPQSRSGVVAVADV